MKELLNDLNIPPEIYLRDNVFTTNSGNLRLHPIQKRTLGCLLMSLF